MAGVVPHARHTEGAADGEHRPEIAGVTVTSLVISERLFPPAQLEPAVYSSLAWRSQ